MASTSVEEREPLLDRPVKKPFYRARPLWLVPFAVVASLVRGMTLAPRVEVYTQLACVSLHHDRTRLQQISNHTALSTLEPLLEDSENSITISLSFDGLDDRFHDDSPRNLKLVPSLQCTSDPAVQKEAARLQTVLTTTMGLFSALTTGAWGHFSERHGRTRVLALSSLGLLITDLTFILVATPGSPLAAHGHKLLVISPLIEGLLGGWSTLQSATNAYVSDCTSPGSRATIFSRFIGVFFLGVSLGPVIGGWVIIHGIPGIDRIGTVTKGKGKSVTEVFWLAITLSIINFLLATFLFPESLTKEQRAMAKRAHMAESEANLVKGKLRSATGDTAMASVGESSTGSQDGATRKLRKFIDPVSSPLALFLPAVIHETTAVGVRRRRDWSLTFLGLAMFLYMLSTGIYQIKYLYAVHTYNWAADQLSYYISYLSGLRAMALLVLFPTVIWAFKPKSPIESKPSKPRLAGEINFDLRLTRCSLFIDLLSQFLITIVPAPGQVHHMSVPSARRGISEPTTPLTALFVIASGFSSVGSGFIPACQSLALCIVQARQLSVDEEGDQAGFRSSSGSGSVREDGNAGTDAAVDQSETGKSQGSHTSTGKLFGALSTLQATGQMILGPLLFGFLYGDTVAFFPKAIFVVGGGILTAALICSFLCRSPVERYLMPPTPIHRKKGKGKKRSEHRFERGRSRASKDLFGVTAHHG